MAFKLIKSPQMPIYISWDDINNNIKINSDSLILIYNKNFSINKEEDLKKAEKLKKLGIKKICFYAYDYKLAKYYDELFPDINKEFHLLNDFELKDRSDINFNGLKYSEIFVPCVYFMHMKNFDGITRFTNTEQIVNGITIDHDDFDLINQFSQLQINKIIDEIFANLNIDNLDDVDKAILVSNYIQNHYQFIEQNGISYSNKRVYELNENIKLNNVNSIKTLIEDGYGVCHAIARLSVLLLNNPRVKCDCCLERTSDHIYFIQTIDGKNYVCDNTWNITRNKNHYNECLKATSFSSDYLLIGQDKLNENEDTKREHTKYENEKSKEPIELYSFPRERIYKSIEKLSAMGVSFSNYDTSRVIEQRISTDVKSKSM